MGAMERWTGKGFIRPGVRMFSLQRILSLLCVMRQDPAGRPACGRMADGGQEDGRFGLGGHPHNRQASGWGGWAGLPEMGNLAWLVQRMLFVGGLLRTFAHFYGYCSDF